MGLSDICSKVLGHRLSKDPNIRLSNWAVRDLSQEQVEYAALDAWAALQVYLRAKECGLQVERTTVQGTGVAYYPTGVSDIAAFGTLVQTLVTPGSLAVETSAVVCISKVLIPGMIVGDDGRCLSDFGNPPFDLTVRTLQLKTWWAVDDVEPTNEAAPANRIDIPSTTDPVIPDGSSPYEDDSSSSDDDSGDDEVVARSTTQPNSRSDNGRNGTAREFRDFDSSRVVHTRVLKDIFHLMQLVPVPKRHGMAREFSCRLRDALFVVDREDRLRIEQHLQSNGTT
jgi:hypothetical protein